VDELGWRGSAEEFAGWAERIGDTRLLKRCLEAASGGR
jgi:hypothetical protein